MLALHKTQTSGVTNVNWNSVMCVVREKMDAAAFNSWILPLAGNVDGDVLSLVAPNQFSVDFINRTFKHFLNDAAATFGLTVQLGIQNAKSCALNNSVNDNLPQKNWNAPAATIENKISGFESFVESDENIFAVTACKKVASGAVSFSPLFIYGPSGCGKSMLANAIASTSTGRVVHMTGAKFVSEFVRSMNEKTVFAFKDFVRNCDTFILDDVGAIAGKRASAEEFITLITDLVRSGKNIVLTSNVAPSQLNGFERGAQSVFASGLSVDLVLPNKNVRRTMLMRAGVSAELADGIADRAPANGHIVSGLAKKISTYTELMGETVSAEIANRLLADVLGGQKTPIVMVKTMAEKLGVSIDDVTSSRRARPIVRARQIMMAALKSATKLSLSEIGTLLGDRDHATVLYGLAQVEKLKQTDLIVAAEIEQMVAICK